jgi:hypothetical protein
MTTALGAEMHFTLPYSRTERITIPVRSSSGQGSHDVVLHGETAGPCPCRGFRYYGRCRHVKTCRGWLEAIIPPGDLPS